MNTQGVFENHLTTRISPFSGNGVVQEIMGMKAGPVRKLLKELVIESIEAPADHIVARLAAGKLAMKEFAYRKELAMVGQVEDKPYNPKIGAALGETGSLLPFSMDDYKVALEYALANAPLYEGLEPEETDENGDAKRGRRSGGGTFGVVQEYMLANPETFEKHNKADVVAKTIAEELDVPETTAVQYVYKCRRLRKQGEI